MKTMGSTEKFCLRWNDFEANISSAFRDLREEKDFSDVTLVCADQQVEAHKVILAACSPFFKKVLRKVQHSHPLIYMKGVKFSDLEAVLSFVYHGEVNMAEEDLNGFLAVAEELEVKGLRPESNSNNQPESNCNRQLQPHSKHEFQPNSNHQPHSDAPPLTQSQTQAGAPKRSRIRDLVPNGTKVPIWSQKNPNFAHKSQISDSTFRCC